MSDPPPEGAAAEVRTLRAALAFALGLLLGRMADGEGPEAAVRAMRDDPILRDLLRLAGIEPPEPGPPPWRPRSGWAEALAGDDGGSA